MDQFSIPLVIELDFTWDKNVCRVPVCFYQPGAVCEKSVFSIKIYLCQRGIQPNITAICLGTERSIVDFDKQAYKYDVIFF